MCRELVFPGHALIGQLVGLTEREDGLWLVRFHDVDLGVIDRARVFQNLWRIDPV